MLDQLLQHAVRGALVTAPWAGLLALIAYLCRCEVQGRKPRIWPALVLLAATFALALVAEAVPF